MKYQSVDPIDNRYADEHGDDGQYPKWYNLGENKGGATDRGHIELLECPFFLLLYNAHSWEYTAVHGEHNDQQGR